jgi:hypothetical protein
MTTKHNFLRRILGLLLTAGILLYAGCVDHPEEDIPEEYMIPSDDLDQSLVGTWIGGSSGGDYSTGDGAGKIIVKIFPSGTGTLTHGASGSAVDGLYKSSDATLTFTPATGSAETFTWSITGSGTSASLSLVIESTTYTLRYGGSPTSTGNPNA